MNKPTRRDFITGTSAIVAGSVAMTKANETGTVSATQSGMEPSKPRFREFLSTVRDQEGYRLKGVGMTVSRAIEHEIENYRDGFDSDTDPGKSYRMTGEAFRDYYCDVVIWEQDRVVAVLQPRADGSMRVTRFDSR